MKSYNDINHKVSIIIPAFNEEEMLPLCLESIQSLDWPEEYVEVIVIDNGSTDNTVQVAISFGAEVYQKKEATVSGLRNFGAEKSSGDILAFVDADCIVSPDWLKKSQIYFDRNDVVAWGNPPGIPENSTWVQRAWHLLRKKQNTIEKVEWLESMNLFVRRNLFDDVSGFDESLITCEDVDFSYRLSEYGHIIADQSIKVQHLGEADTVKVFIRKELWRGKGNYAGLFKHGLSLKELPSLVMPVYMGLFLPSLIISVIVNRSGLLLFPTLSAIILPGIITLVKVRKKKASLGLKSQLFILSYVYFIVRTIALIPSKSK